MIVVHTRQHDRIEIPNGARIEAGSLPVVAVPGAQPAQVVAVVAADGRQLALFRANQLVGFDLSGAVTTA